MTRKRKREAADMQTYSNRFPFSIDPFIYMYRILGYFRVE